MLNEILIRRKRCVHLASDGREFPIGFVGTILRNLEGYGYTLSPDVIDRLRCASMEAAVSFYNEVAATIRKLTGANKKFSPMYPNFPKQVMEASDAELYVNALLHYLGDIVGVRILPEYEKDERPPIFEDIKPVVLGLMEIEDVHKMFSNIMSSSTSISKTDQEDLAWYVKEYAGNLRIPEEIPNKEVLAFLAGLLPIEALASHFKTATDLLRLAVAMSGGDVSLASKTDFRSFKRSERRFFLGRLESMRDPTSDMARHRSKWIRLGERLHPGEFRKVFPNALYAFTRIRNGSTIETNRSRVEKALADGDALAAAVILRMTPGDLARRMDHLLRLTTEYDEILSAFSDVVDQVSTPVVLQIGAHFENRPGENDTRVIFPKGAISKLKVLPPNGKQLPPEVTSAMYRICRESLVRRFSKLAPMGKVFLSTDMMDYTVPFSQRSASRALRTLSRGSRIPIGDKNTIRLFIWWRDMAEGETEWQRRVDIDLSVVLFTEDWKYYNHVSWTNIRLGWTNLCCGDGGVFHSGDITSAPNGACEFIDIDIESLRRVGVRYALPSVFSYSGQKFIEMPECYFGWMERGAPRSGEIFEPSTVVQKIDVSADTKVCVPVVVDIEQRGMTWADMALKNNRSYSNTVESNGVSLPLMGKAMVELRKPNLYHLFSCHVEARGGELVENVKEADVVFSPYDGITPYDFDEIVANWLV